MLTRGEIDRLGDSDLLSKIAEECSEIIHAAMKFQVHGARPLAKGVQYNNHSDLMEEFRQLSKYVEALDDRFHRYGDQM